MKKIITLSAAAMIFSLSTFATDFYWAKKIKPKRNLLSLSSPDLFQSHVKLLTKADKGGDAFHQGAFVVSAGYGFPNLWKSVVNLFIGSNATNITATGMGPLHFRAEYGISNGVGLAASINYMSFGAKWTTNDSAGVGIYQNKLSSSSLSVLARLNFHFSVTDQLDPYFGIGAGYKNRTWKYTTTDPAYANKSAPGFSPFGFEMTIGMRYYITDAIGIYTEIGIAKSVIQAGLAAKF